MLSKKIPKNISNEYQKYYRVNSHKILMLNILYK